MLTAENYVELRRKEEVCPFCEKKGYLEFGEYGIDEIFFKQEVWCSACGAEWKDVYELIGFDAN